MKLFIILFVCSALGLVLANPVEHNRGCVYILGRCAHECPVGTHSYNTGCGFMTPEATCEEPHPKLDSAGAVCDFSACYCDAPTVRNTATNKCVPLDQCPKKPESVENTENEA